MAPENSFSLRTVHPKGQLANLADLTQPPNRIVVNLRRIRSELEKD